jgi:hypothetical protein
MLEKFPKTVSLLIDLTFNYEHWDLVPDELRHNIYNEFVREIHPVDFTNYITNAYSREDFAILLISEFEPEDCKKFVDNIFRFFKPRCNNGISELFEKVKQHFIDAKFLKNEMKDENKLKEKFNLT